MSCIHQICRFFVLIAGVLTLAVPARAQLVIDGETISSQEVYEAAKKEGHFVVYSAIAQDIMKALLEDFQKDTGITPELVRLVSQPLFQRINAEFSAGRLEADYLDLTDLPLIQQLVERGVLNVAYKVPAFDRIQNDLRDDSGRWYGVLRTVSPVAVNTSRVAPADIPKRWADLADPKYKGLIATTNIDAGGSAFTLYAFMREILGVEFWKQLAAQKPRLYPGVAPLVNDLTRGESGIGMGSINELVSFQMKSGAPLKIVLPAEGVSSFPASGGITASAKHPNAARLYLDWMTSKRGGDRIAIAFAYGLNPLSGKPMLEGMDYPPGDKLWNINLARWVALREPWSAEWREIFGTK
jgi:iron(III) transport system substrate-binding protein